jgi:hypothetical protein
MLILRVLNSSPLQVIKNGEVKSKKVNYMVGLMVYGEAWFSLTFSQKIKQLRSCTRYFHLLSLQAIKNHINYVFSLPILWTENIIKFGLRAN